MPYTAILRFKLQFGADDDCEAILVLEKTITLPFVPFVGMMINHLPMPKCDWPNASDETVTQVTWNVQAETFTLFTRSFIAHRYKTGTDGVSIVKWTVGDVSRWLSGSSLSEWDVNWSHSHLKPRLLRRLLKDGYKQHPK